jgi:GNAT superfamily N-acetyltransferase
LLTIERLENIKDIPSSEWNNLLAASETQSIFMTHQWIDCWLQTFGSGNELFTLIAKDNGAIIGVAPLMLSSTKGGFRSSRILQFIGASDSISCDFICAPERKKEVLESFFKYIDDNRQLFDFIRFERIPVSSSTVDFIRSSINRFSFVSNELKSKTRHWLVPSGALEPSKSIKLNFNDSFKHQTIRHTDEFLNQIDKILKSNQDYRLFNNQRDKLYAGKAREFLQCLIVSLSPGGYFQADILKKDNEVAACNIGLVFNGSLSSLLPVINLDYYLRKPSEHLLYKLLGICASMGINRLEIPDGWLPSDIGIPIEETHDIAFEIRKRGISSALANIADSFKNNFDKAFPSLGAFLRKYLNRVMISDMWIEISYLLRKNGPIGNVVLICQRIIRRGFPFYSPTIVLFKMDLDDRNRSREHGDFIIRDGRLSDWLDLVGHATVYRRWRYIMPALRRFQDGERLFVVEKDGHLVHYSWVAFVDTIRLPEAGVAVKLPQKAWYIYNSFTAEDIRRKGIYTAVLVHVAYELGDVGGKELYGYTMAGNIAAKSGIGKTGAWQWQLHHMTKIMGITLSKSCRTLPKPKIE